MPTPAKHFAQTGRALGPWMVPATLSVAVPMLLAYNLPPSPTLLNQTVALFGWAFWLTWLARLSPALPRPRHSRGASVLTTALAVVALSVLLSLVAGSLPSPLAFSALGIVVAAGLTSEVARRAPPPIDHQQTAVAPLYLALVLAGVLSALTGIMQVFAPQWADGVWIARPGIAGRAVGNLRQPNHLSTLLLWSAVAVVPLLLSDAEGARHNARRVLGALLFALMLFGVVLSGSRTGLVSVALLCLWGLLDRRLARPARLLLIVSPAICAASWLFLGWWSDTYHVGALGAATRLGQSDDISSARFSIWRDTLALIAQNPWLGVGFGEFNFAWTLTPFPDRNGQFFDHTHNLPLHLAVELGVPLALLVLGLLLWGLWQAFKRSTAVAGPHGVALRAAFVMLLLMALHSQLEYPLWYAYFLLPTAFAWGLCLGADSGAPHDAQDAQDKRPPAHWLAAAGVTMLLGAAVTLWDYRKVVDIFAPPLASTAPLAERIALGRHSWLFAHHADYALVTTIDGANALPGAFDRAPHFLLDTRLMMAWAQGLAAQGDVERARYIAARLREFRNSNSKEFFAPCDDAAAPDKPFQCTPPTQAFTWRDFTPQQLSQGRSR